MAHRLALAMGRSVRELSATIDTDEWMDWLAFYSLEPWGTHIEDDRWEKLCRISFSAFGGKPPAEPFFDRDPKLKKVETLDERVRGFFTTFKEHKAAEAAEQESDQLNI